MAEPGQDAAPQDSTALPALPLSEESARRSRAGLLGALLLHAGIAGPLLWAASDAAGGSGGGGGLYAIEVVMSGGGPARAEGTADSQAETNSEGVEAAPQPPDPPAPLAAAESPPAPAPAPEPHADAGEAVPPPGPDPTLAAAAPPEPPVAVAEVPPAPVTAPPAEPAAAAPPEKPAAAVAVPAPQLKPTPAPEPPRQTAALDPAPAEAQPDAATATGEGPTLASPAAGAGSGGVTASVGDGGKARRAYEAELMAWLQSHKRYPKSAERRRQQGIATVAFQVAPNGQVTGVRLVAGSGYELLDQEALNLLTRAAPLPAFPPGLPPEPLALTLPVSFTLR